MAYAFKVAVNSTVKFLTLYCQCKERLFLGGHGFQDVSFSSDAKSSAETRPLLELVSMLNYFHPRSMCIFVKKTYCPKS